VEKAPDAFRTISEVADELDVPQHVLRFWESRFRDIKPMKRGGGRRYYRPDDVDLLRGIRHLLYGEGYTIRGVQRILKEQGVKFVQAVWQPGAPQLKQQPADDQRAAGDAAAPRAPADEQPARRVLGIMRPPEERMRPEPPPQQRAQPPERRELPSPRIVPPQQPAAGIGKQDLRKLQEALQQLTECRAQLDAAIADVTLGSAPIAEAGKP
jgi:DNA-binding transcriptional MerR regulator